MTEQLQEEMDPQEEPEETEGSTDPETGGEKEWGEPLRGKQGRKSDMAYTIQFRQYLPNFAAKSRIQNICAGELVMVQTDHGPEPATVICRNSSLSEAGLAGKGESYFISRRCTREDKDKLARIISREEEAFAFVKNEIERLRVPMKLIGVERYFNGGKILFYFTAENRVDFRELVKILVQEFRTRVEMRQVGVRHETKMLGGLGCCGLELCCRSYIRNFAPVSIKMAKEQDLPLNPGKISGICNRLLCCLTYEYDYYKEFKKHLPKVGKMVRLGDRQVKIVNINVSCETITIYDPEETQSHRVLSRAEWEPLCAEVQMKKAKGGQEEK